MRLKLKYPIMSSAIEGNLDASGLKFAVVCARFNSFITDRLLAGALDALKRSGAADEDVEVVKVPGSWELPLAAKTIAGAKKHDAIIALGAVIRGDTPHFDNVAGECAHGLQLASLETGVPIAFGVLTVENREQALERAATNGANKGGEAMECALEMAALMARL